jgi:hypothetical protein
MDRNCSFNDKQIRALQFLVHLLRLSRVAVPHINQKFRVWVDECGGAVRKYYSSIHQANFSGNRSQ